MSLWSKGNLAHGFTSLAQYLGVSSHEAVFANSLVVNPEGTSWRLAASDDLEGISHQYILGLSSKDSTALHLPLTPQQSHYVHTYIASGTLHQVTPSTQGRYYPEASIIATLADNQANNPHILQGKWLLNSYITDDLMRLAQRTNGHMLMTEQSFLRFVGKEYVHAVAPEIDLPVATAVVMDTADQTDAYIQAFRSKIKKQGKNPDTTPVWIKPTSLSGGQGVIGLKTAETGAIKEALWKIDKIYRDCGFGPKLNDHALFDQIHHFMPIVMELDVGMEKGIARKLYDTGVQAVISDKSITHLETLVNKTVDGEYLGGSLPSAPEAEAVFLAEKEAAKLLHKMWKDGYRGYVGVDAMVTERSNGQLTAFVNEANTRLTGNTPLVGLAHRFSHISDQKLTGFSTACRMAMPNQCQDAFEYVSSRLGKDLFQAEKSAYQGIIPAVIDTPPQQGVITFKAVVLAPTISEVMAINRRLKETLSNA